jgi:hypothetical protein
MARIAFFRQGRRDGGIRTRIEIERDTVLGRFEEGTDEPDPVLTWLLDIECEGDSLPAEREAARRWFLDHAEEIRGELESLARLLGVGLDIDSGPFRQKSLKKIEGQDVSIEVGCSALRRLEAQRIAEFVRDVAERWEDLVRNLPALEEITL